MVNFNLLLEHEPETIVYLKTDPDQLPRIVTAFCWRAGRVTFELSMGTQTSWHSSIEISPVKSYFNEA